MKFHYHVNLILVLIVVICVVSECKVLHFKTENGLQNKESNKQVVSLPRLELKYHNYKEVEAILKSVHSVHPDISQLYSIGKSVEGKDLLVLELSNKFNVGTIKPNVRLLAADEPVAKEMMLNLIFHLVQNYRTDNVIRWLLDNTRIHILPLKNPDRFLTPQDGDCDHFRDDISTNENRNEEEDETEAVLLEEWSKRFNFVLSANFQSGERFSSMLKERENGLDEVLLNHLISTYTTFSNSSKETCSTTTVSKAKSYYDRNGFPEMQFQVSCCSYSPASDLPKIWEDNEDSVMKLLLEAHKGVKGTIKNLIGIPIREVKLKVRGSNVAFSTTTTGEFSRILLPGIYTLEIFADGYRTLEHTFAVDGKSPATILHLTLTPITDFPTTDSSKDGLMSKNDVAEDRTPIYVPKIPKNVWESFLNSLNLLNILTLFPKFFRN